MKLENIETAKKLLKQRDELAAAVTRLVDTKSARMSVIVGDEERVIPYEFKDMFISLIYQIKDDVEAEIATL